MARTEYIKITIDKNFYEVPAVDHPEGYAHDAVAMLGAIIVKLHQRVEELEWAVDDMRSCK